MIETIEALDAWWPPTLMPSVFSLSWLAASIMRVANQSTRCSTACSASSCVTSSGRGDGGKDLAAHELDHLEELGCGQAAHVHVTEVEVSAEHLAKGADAIGHLGGAADDGRPRFAQPLVVEGLEQVL